MCRRASTFRERRAPGLRRHGLRGRPRDRRAPGSKLIELQAFPSLYAFQLYQSLALRDLCPRPRGSTSCSPDLDPEGYRPRGRRRDPGRPAAGERRPAWTWTRRTQKTSVDFAFTEKLWNVRARLRDQARKRGRELWYDRDGKATRILRIYNRLIFDEIAYKGIALPIDFREELDVSWAGHSNWYYRWSKHALPVAQAPDCPGVPLPVGLRAAPADLENWVLKPLFSFAGAGVKVDVTRADLDAIPPEERSAHAPDAQEWTTRRSSKRPTATRRSVEVRVMFIWKDGRPLPRHDPRPPLPGKDDGRRLQQGPHLGVVGLPLAEEERV